MQKKKDHPQNREKIKLSTQKSVNIHHIFKKQVTNNK